MLSETNKVIFIENKWASSENGYDLYTKSILFIFEEVR